MMVFGELLLTTLAALASRLGMDHHRQFVLRAALGVWFEASGTDNIPKWLLQSTIPTGKILVKISTHLASVPVLYTDTRFTYVIENE
jgi:hypothetical protein